MLNDVELLVATIEEDLDFKGNVIISRIVDYCMRGLFGGT